jgi:hypothetical integral membrane protein (TIGR02206 family)
MLEFFTGDWRGEPFQLFGPAHLTGIAIIVGVNLFLLFGWKNPTLAAKRFVRYTLATILIVTEILWHWWNWYVGQWSIQYMLPLHVCTIMVWLCAIVLITGNYSPYDFIYFLGIGGATQVILTPDSGIYGFPHFRFFQPLISHGAIVTTAIYLTAIEGLRPHWRSLRTVIIVTNLYMIPIFVLNLILGSNYMFIGHKPETPNIIDMLPGWPCYIPWLEVIGVAVFLFLYAPFAVKDWRAKKQDPKGS